ncbi:hypothetical protein NKDENANG_02420 [Candidatus Entotheonellaceae bacterium PAL068K]
MGTLRLASPVKLFCALLLCPTLSLDKVEERLQQQFGAIVLRSQPSPFTQTTYYQREMGEGLIRQYVAFEPLIARAELAAMKHTTNHLESEWSLASGQRRINLDPGYLDLAKVVLASTKDHAHRLYIGAAIYAEITLRYRRKQFQPCEWTYPDYRLPATRAFFEQLRDLYKAQLQHVSQAS